MNDVTKTSSNRSQPDSNQNNSIKSQNKEKKNNQSQNSASVDSARVAEVQSAISNGEYTVDANRIADKILAFEDFINK